MRNICNFFCLTGLRWIWVTLIILIIDLCSKLLILYNLSLGEIIHIFPFLNLYYTRNYGIAFGLLNTEDSIYRYFFIIITIISCIIILLLMYSLDISKKRYGFAYSLILGGALGNLINRLQYGFVIDMIDFYFYKWHFATFNFADSAICIGSMLILFKV